MYTHTQQKKKKKSLVSSIKIVAARYPSNSSIWDPINLYVGYILILPVWPQASLGSCLNKTLLSSVPLLFPSLHSCVSQFPSISLSPFIFFPTNLYNVHLLLILQSLLSEVVIITYPLDKYSHIPLNPHGSSRLQRILLELVLGVNQCSVVNSPKSLIVLGIDLDLIAFSWPFLWLA